MDHAEAHERIVDLALEPHGLDRLDLEGSEAALPADRAFVDHVRGCPACMADLAVTRATSDRLDFALADVRDATAVEPIGPPGWLRDAVLDAARRERRVAPAAGPAIAGTGSGTGAAAPWALPRWTAPRWAGAIAAALAIALLGGLAGSAIQRLAGGPDASMVAVVTTLDRVLAAPEHRLVALRTSGGTAVGSVAWSASDFAVLTSSLPAPRGDQVYRCWLEWSGRWAPVGMMEFAGGTAYWTGPTGEWAEVVAKPDARFVVTLEAASTAPGERPSGPTILEAGLGS